ncbi:AMP-binding protein [Actinophytocola oryzae]|uniref:Acyl-CoA synthetase (AMP-forming)/AMP-acid ligase II n=1 Tax=Actinophytocola oryzae TaxID=502181 RepID=A0A4R7VFS5_9PSEU|nr:AMP-binding protein [Actinophytocola oryzae]TDV47888.1 acyl-CoA synthetase (AMP-forming)/AMP-acid ligase II [Actinophytocola oryzae]
MTNTIAGAVDRHAGTSPDAPALIWRETVVTYGELAAGMRAAAAGLASLPAGPVGVRARKSAQAVTFVLGCLAAGRTVVLPSPTLPAETLTALFERAGARAVVDEADLARFTTGDTAPSTVDTAFMLTTSGSTGVPKLVPIDSDSVERFARWTHDVFDVGPGRRVLNYAPLNFDLCLFEIWATLRHGGCVVLVNPEIAADCDALLALVETTRPHVVQAVPLFYQLLTEAAGGTHTLPSVAHVIFTGDATSPERLGRLHALFPAARLHNIYGCTETNDSFRHEVRVGDERRSALPLGEPLPGVHADLVADNEILTGPGVGELVVRTPFQSAGYHDSATGAFGPHPVRADGNQYFRSGDLVRRDENGEYFLEGRADFRVKVRGQQVYLQHVEEVLLAAEDVIEAAAVAVPDEHAGKRLHVVVRRRDGSRLNSLALRRYLSERLPPAAIPSTLHIGSEPLPRTSTGKVDRQTLVANSQKR